LINYQGRVAVGVVNPVNFNGSGSFKFALVNSNGTVTYSSNDGSSTAGSQPTAAVALTVTKGLYSVLLGDTSLANMTAIPNSVFTNADVRLRVWFNDGTNGSQLPTPDHRLAPNGYVGGNAALSLAIPPGMALILAGPFTMGNSVALDTDITDANPVTTSASAFYMDVKEVSLSQWRSVYYWASTYSFSAGSGKAANHPAGGDLV
jgi:formylglycine-generating enzyme required for sulfatase activity